jgi:hypothetical protein
MWSRYTKKMRKATSKQAQHSLPVPGLQALTVWCDAASSGHSTSSPCCYVFVALHVVPIGNLFLQFCRLYRPPESFPDTMRPSWSVSPSYFQYKGCMCMGGYDASYVKK